MKKIIHLSDLHIGYKDCGDKFHAIIRAIISSKKPEDHIIVITGDIVENANRTKQTSEAVRAIDELKKSGYVVLVVPGNHDYGNGGMGKKKFVGIFKEKYYGSRDISYPKLDIIGSTAFIGLDSNAEELKWHNRFFSEGKLGKKQLKRLEKMLKNPKVKNRKKVLYLHHHPFDFKLGMHLKDKKRLKKIIHSNVDALLYGHYHRDRESAGKVYNGKWGIPRCYNAGSSTHKNGHIGFQRIIDLSDPDPAKDSCKP
jgi:3',5'-cyclic AMP phosphodiesterase CpdA